MQDEWLTTTDVAKILKCGRQTVKEYMLAGLIPAIKVGTHMKARRLAVEDFMKSCDGKDISDPYNVKPIEAVS